MGRLAAGRAGAAAHALRFSARRHAAGAVCHSPRRRAVLGAPAGHCADAALHCLSGAVWWEGDSPGGLRGRAYSGTTAAGWSVAAAPAGAVMADRDEAAMASGNAELTGWLVFVLFVAGVYALRRTLDGWARRR